MAKKTEKTKTERKGTLAAAKDVVVTVAEKVADVVSDAADVANEHVVRPVAEALGVTKPKKKRFVREKVEMKPKSKPVPVPKRSTKAAGKMMTKGLAAAPKEETQIGPRSKSRARP